jgi:hypothetical protein
MPPMQGGAAAEQRTMSRKKKPKLTNYFDEMKKLFPDVPITCPGCDTPGEPHKPWCGADKERST